MRFTFCPDCGARLSHRDLGDEVAVPWCDACDKPWFDVFPVAIIALVYDENGDVLLLRQNYISDTYCNLVSGYVKPGETCEETAVREIREETGQEVEELRLVLTNWFERKGMMMVGFLAHVTRRPLRLSTEVDSATWHHPSEILNLVHPFPHSTSRILSRRYLATLKA